MTYTIITQDSVQWVWYVYIRLPFQTSNSSLKKKNTNKNHQVLKVKLLSLEPFPSPKATTHFPCRSTTCAAPASAPHFTSAATLRRSSSKGAAAKPSASGVDRGKPQRDEDLDDDAGRFKVPTMAANGRCDGKLEKNLWFLRLRILSDLSGLSGF